MLQQVRKVKDLNSHVIQYFRFLPLIMEFKYMISCFHTSRCCGCWGTVSLLWQWLIFSCYWLMQMWVLFWMLSQTVALSSTHRVSKTATKKVIKSDASRFYRLLYNYFESMTWQLQVHLNKLENHQKRYLFQWLSLKSYIYTLRNSINRERTI